MEMHNLHFILFTTLIQHLYKEKKRKNDDIYAPFIAKYINLASDQKRETSPGHTLYRKKSPSHCSSYCSLVEKADLLPVREQPFVIEIDRRFIPPVPVMHREEITARGDTHKFNDRVRSSFPESWIERDHGSVEAPSAYLLNLSSVDLK